MAFKIIMKKIISFFFFLSIAHVAIGQTKIDLADSTSNLVFTVVEKMPTFPGGEKKMAKFIKKNIKHPPAAYKEGRAGICYITFIVEIDGSLSGIRVLKGASGGADLDEEALRVIKLMPKWKPGKQNGHIVRVVYNLPIRFLR
jgi:protein TonB